MRRRTLALAALAAATALPGTAAWSADAFPNKPLKLIVGFAAGGGADVLTRIIAEGLAKQLGQQVIVENRPGADGVLAAQATSSARPDGYTLLMGTNTAMVAAPTLRPTPPYDPFKAFTPISSAGQFSMFLVVPASLPVKSVDELLALVASKPGALNSASSNSASELAMLQLLGDRKVVNARYKGDMQAMTDLLILLAACTGAWAAIATAAAGLGRPPTPGSYGPALAWIGRRGRFFTCRTKTGTDGHCHGSRSGSQRHQACFERSHVRDLAARP